MRLSYRSLKILQKSSLFVIPAKAGMTNLFIERLLVAQMLCYIGLHRGWVRSFIVTPDTDVKARELRQELQR